MDFWNKFPSEDFFQGYTGRANCLVQNVNAHLHTPYSYSTFETIEQALNMAKKENVKIAGINDFYSTDGYREWAEHCNTYKIFPLFNIEFVGLSNQEQNKRICINDPKNPGRIYMRKRPKASA